MEKHERTQEDWTILLKQKNKDISELREKIEALERRNKQLIDEKIENNSLKAINKELKEIIIMLKR